MNLETVQRWSDCAKNIFQILALIIAGIWTYLLFIRTEVPTLEYRTNTNSKLYWSETSRPGECIAHFNVTHKNIGRSSYKISAYRLRAWTFKRTRVGDELLRYVDLQDIQNQEPLFDKRYTSGPFVTQFPPNASFRHAFEWVAKQVPDTLMSFRIDLYIEGEENAPRWHSGSWSECAGVVHKLGSPNKVNAVDG